MGYMDEGPTRCSGYITVASQRGAGDAASHAPPQLRRLTSSPRLSPSSHLFCFPASLRILDICESTYIHPPRDQYQITIDGAHHQSTKSPFPFDPRRAPIFLSPLTLTMHSALPPINPESILHALGSLAGQTQRKTTYTGDFPTAAAQHMSTIAGLYGAYFASVSVIEYLCTQDLSNFQTPPHPTFTQVARLLSIEPET